MKNNIILQAKNISKYYPGVIALNNFNFDLRAGEVHCIVGENGAGKTTFVKILSGAINKSSGKLIIDNSVVEINSPRDAQDLGISIIYQEPKLNLVPYFSVTRNVFLGNEIINKFGFINFKKMDKYCREIISALDIELDPQKRIIDLSVAEKTLVQIVKAMKLNAKIFIIDEATSSLTKFDVEKLIKIIITLKKQGKGIIFISHNLDEVLKIGDRVTVLRDGNLIATKEKSELKYYDLIQMMVGRKIVDEPLVLGINKSDNILEVKNIFSRTGLKNINFTLNSSEILGFAGIVGSGRTEVARILFGVDKIVSGKILLNGSEIKLKSPFDAIKNGIVMIPEDRLTQGILAEMSVMENITLASIEKVLKFGFKLKKKQAKIADKYIKNLSIKTPNRNQLVKYLSGGNQQKVVFSKFINTSAKIFIMDEPTRGIDVGAKRDIHSLIIDLAKRGIGVIIISSELPELIKLCDRILVFRKGNIVGELKGKDINQLKIIELATGGEG